MDRLEEAKRMVRLEEIKTWATLVTCLLAMFALGYWAGGRAGVMPEEKRQEITSREPVELWGSLTTLRVGGSIPIPYRLVPADGGLATVTPAEATADAGLWTEYSVCYSVWARGSEEDAVRFLSRIADEAVEHATSRELER